jgi:hypothetical protein
MSLFRRKTPEEKEAERRERQRQKEEKERKRQRQREAEEARKALEAERVRIIKASQKAIEDFYVSQARKWEYKTVLRTRGATAPADGGRAKPWDIDIERERLAAWGEEGWDLVAVVPRSRYYTMYGSGFMGEELWVFKRPRPPLPTELVQALKDAKTYGQGG